MEFLTAAAAEHKREQQGLTVAAWPVDLTFQSGMARPRWLQGAIDVATGRDKLVQPECEEPPVRRHLHLIRRQQELPQAIARLLGIVSTELGELFCCFPERLGVGANPLAIGLVVFSPQP